MTDSWRLVAAFCLVLVFSGFLLSSGDLLIVALPFLVLALFPFVLRFPKARAEAAVEVDRILAQSGQAAEVRISVTNTGPALPSAILSVLLPEGIQAEGETWEVCSLETDQVRSLSFRAAASRGKYDFEHVRLEIFDVLGFRKQETLISLHGSVSFMPKVERLEQLEIAPSKTRALPGSVRSRATGSGSEFFGTRQYAPGDPLRQLNWRAGNRWGLLVTNVFSEERTADVGIVLDARRACEVMVHGESLFENSVCAAASLADYFLRRGNRVGLLNYGSFIDWVFPGYGKLQRARILSALCRVQPDEHAAFREFGYLPVRLFPPRAQLVFISPLQPDDAAAISHLRALEFELLVLSPDPISFEARKEDLDEYGGLAQRILRAQRICLLSRLRRSGVRVIEWDVSIPLGVALHRLGRGRPR